jgi:hypothetical protein
MKRWAVIIVLAGLGLYGWHKGVRWVYGIDEIERWDKVHAAAEEKYNRALVENLERLQRQRRHEAQMAEMKEKHEKEMERIKKDLGFDREKYDQLDRERARIAHQRKLEDQLRLSRQRVEEAKLGLPESAEEAELRRIRQLLEDEKVGR